MKRFSLLLFSFSLFGGGSLAAQNVSIKATNRPAAAVFAEIMRQTDKNFIYSSSLLNGLKVSVNARNEPLEKVLSTMFSGTGITYRVRGNNIMLQAAKTAPVTNPRPQARKKVTVSGYVREADTQETLIGITVRDLESGTAVVTNNSGFYSLSIPAGSPRLQVSGMGYSPYTSESVAAQSNVTYNFSLSPVKELQEVVVNGSRNYALNNESAEAGAFNLSASTIASTPVMFGEPDVIKSLQFEPGVSSGIEGLAGMYVHGGNGDENLYMIDNVPLYQVNHFAGLFSAFNIEALKNVDFYKSSFPAKYDGRLSSFVDVHTKDGSLDKHHGSARLGLTSGSFNIDGPIRKGSTSYSVALRRSWYDVLTIPALAIINALDENDEKRRFRYAFTDLNAKITHHFSERSRADVMFYYGEDALEGGSSSEYGSYTKTWEDDIQKLHWGNILAKAGWSYMISPTLFGEFTGAWSRFFSNLSSKDEYKISTEGKVTDYYYKKTTSSNRIDDVSLRAAFDWRPSAGHHVSFGADAVYHWFLPSKSTNHLITTDVDNYARYDGDLLHAFEANLYIGDDWRISDALRVNAGLHGSLFSIDSKTYFGFSPRLTVRYGITDLLNFKTGYSRTTQYVHQLTETYLSLPTDQWVPVTKGFQPQTADKVFAGFYYSTPGGEWLFSVEGFYKWMHHLVEYRDEFYINHPGDDWLDQLTSGKGTAKGLDFKVSREFGNITGQASYSLLWSDRTFAERNGGKTYPSRYDNRHKINLMVNWKINSKWEVNAAWTGMSGNMVTLPVNVWESPKLPGSYYEGGGDVPVDETINNYRLPFYHRLDLSAKRHTKHGFWTFSLYNAYCNMNVVAVRLEDKYVPDPTGQSPYSEKIVPVFQKLHLLPVIPSVSYTWIF